MNTLLCPFIYNVAPTRRPLKCYGSTLSWILTIFMYALFWTYILLWNVHARFLFAQRECAAGILQEMKRWLFSLFLLYTITTTIIHNNNNTTSYCYIIIPTRLSDVEFYSLVHAKLLLLLLLSYIITREKKYFSLCIHIFVTRVRIRFINNSKRWMIRILDLNA